MWVRLYLTTFFQVQWVFRGIMFSLLSSNFCEVVIINFVGIFYVVFVNDVEHGNDSVAILS